MYSFIKDRLKELGKKQNELAEYLGVPPSHVNVIIKGTRLIKSSEIIPICKFLKLDAGKFALYIAGKMSKEELLSSPLTNLYKVGYVQAGMFNEAYQLPEDEWTSVPYPVNELYKNANLFALGVRGNSMNKIFPPEQTTLICCPLIEWERVNPDTELNGKYVVVYRKKDGLYEATVKRYERKDEETVMLFAESTEKEFEFPIILHPDSNEYEIAAVVISYLREC